MLEHEPRCDGPLNDCGVDVADGMGGHPAGDLAAQTAVAVATQRARERAAWRREYPSAGAEFVADLVTSADRRIHDLILAKPSLKGMGTTVVTLAITPAPMPVAHTPPGRSRAISIGRPQSNCADHTLSKNCARA